MNDNPKYKAIETIHSGYRFRSRLEARWSIFFETLGIEYRYEPEGFELDDIRYLPDFYLPKLETWIEIKPDTPTQEEREKAIQLCLATEQEVALFTGNVWHDVKGHIFSPLCYEQDLQQKDVKDILAETPTTWLSTAECIAVHAPDRLLGFNLQRKFCWSYAEWTQCSLCNSVVVYGLGACLCACGKADKRRLSKDTPALAAAYTAARQARF